MGVNVFGRGKRLLLSILLIPLPGVAAVAPGPAGLRVPALAYDDHSITLAWQAPRAAAGIVDYRVYQDGVPVGTAGEGANGAAAGYIKRFYADPANGQQVRIATTSYTAKGLTPGTKYRFSVRAVYADGTESRAGNTVVQSTAASPAVYNVVDFGAVGDGTTLNTGAIQRAIDACRRACKVLVPAGTFKTGAIWLHSDMTFEVARGARLLGSERAADYPWHYLLYPYSTDERFYSLINAHTYDYGSIHDLRIVGEGTIDGNGWKQTGADADGNPVYAQGSASTVQQTGILAADQVTRAAALGSPAPYPTRSNLITLRGARDVYLGGFTAANPANHTISLIHDRDVTVDGVNIQTYNANNGDGIEWINSDGLTVMNTVFNTGDDCMNFAAGLGAAAPGDGPSQHAWIFDDYFRHGHGAVVTGSHTGAWIQHILAENNVVDGTDVGLRMKTAPANGGGVRDVEFRDTAIRATTAEAFVFTSAYGDPNAAIVVEPAAVPARFEDVHVDNVTVDGTGGPSIHVVGVAGAAHRDLVFTGVRFRQARPTAIAYLRDSAFRDVTFDHTAQPWVITNSSGLSFTGATTVDAVSADASAGPGFPAGARLDVSAAGVLTWPAASDNTGVSAYQVVRDGVVVATVSGTRHAATGLAPDVRYRFAVRAVDATGNTSRDLSAWVTTAGPPDRTGPVVAGAPSVVPGSVGYTWARLAWPAATDEHGVDHYEVSANGRVIGRADATGFVATGLAAGTTYTFTVTAVDASGNATTYPATASATTLPAYDTGAPGWPTPHPRLAVRRVTGTSVTVSWPAARDDRAVSGYRVLVDGRAVGGDDFTPIDTGATTTGTSYPITGLTPATRYVVAVEAGDAMGRWSGPHPAAVVTTARE